jgi:hypothetical protein
MIVLMCQSGERSRGVLRPSAPFSPATWRQCHRPEAKGSLAPIGMGVVQSIKTLGGVGQRGNVAMDELSELLPTITCVGLLALFLVFEAVRH